MKSTFLNALAKKNDSHIPVWFMRQAGRYLPEYLELKDQYDFRTRTHTPNLMKEITLQPMRRYPLDASIMFSDILTCLEFMGAKFDFTGAGPRLTNPGIETLQKINSLNTDDMSFVYDGIKAIKEELGERPLIGFVGAPFTLCSYIIEGGTSKDFLLTKRYIFDQPENFHQSMSLLSESVGNYLLKQMETGVDAVQIFDSWVGFLSLDVYKEHVLPHLQNLIKKVKAGGKPVILYSQPCSHLLPALAQSGADAIGIDWRISLKDAVNTLEKNGFEGAIQGNLDPVTTTLEWEKTKPYVDKVLNSAKEAGILNRYIFNVGHGVNPTTKFETLDKIIDYVHQRGQS